VIALIVDRAKYNEYMRVYMAARYARRRAAAIAHLGGKCVDCGTTESLEFDHRDRDQKTYDIGRRLAGVAEARFWDEVAKCDLRCKRHHVARTREQMSVPHGGGVAGRSRCKCVPCKARKAEYMRNYKKSRVTSSIGRAPSP
jgi:hypothetical protein